MITARLTDHIWSTRKAESLNGLKLMQAEIIGDLSGQKNADICGFPDLFAKQA